MIIFNTGDSCGLLAVLRRQISRRIPSVLVNFGSQSVHL